jgi:hypothetical protein
VHADAAAGQLGADAARERELRVLGGRVGARGSVRERARHRDDVDDVRGPRGFEQRQEGLHAPDTAEVDSVDDLLGLLGLELEEASPAGEARVVHQEPDRRMALCDPRGDPVHLRAIGDVAGLGFGPDLGRHFRELLRSACDEDAVPAPRGEHAGCRGPDSARPSGDDGDSHAATIDSSRLG